MALTTKHVTELRGAVDTALANYLMSHSGAMPSQVSALTLCGWLSDGAPMAQTANAIAGELTTTGGEKRSHKKRHRRSNAEVAAARAAGEKPRSHSKKTS